VVESGVEVEGIPEHDDIDDKPEDAELVLLALTIALADLPAAAVAHGPGKSIATLSAIELHQDLSAVGLVVDVAQQVECLVDASDMGDGPRQLRLALTVQQRSHQLCRTDGAELERPRHSKHVLPVAGDQLPTDVVSGELLENTVVGVWIHPPEPSALDVGQAWAELVAEQPEQAEYDVARARRVSHDLLGIQRRLLLQKRGQDDE
jgi:hypothetical protein